MKLISINEIENVRIGQAEDAEGGTGCTVIIADRGMGAGLDVRGGGPASRESELLKPVASAEIIHAVVLAGGSAYGLAAADGVMEYLEEKGIGFDVGPAKVPLVCQSDLFDLTVGDVKARPGRKMGYDACVASERKNYRDGDFGAGTGATVGKLFGMERCMKSGIGSMAVDIDGFRIGAVVAVNAFGDVFDRKTGEKIAGLRSEDGRGFTDSLEEMCMSMEVVENRFTANTTIGAVITNGAFTKSQLCKIAAMAHNGYARTIRPVNTSADGDSIYALSAGDVKADMDTAGSIASELMAEAVNRAVRASEGGYGYPAVCDMK